MRMSDEIQARLNHSVHELCEVQQLLATASDRVQTAFDAIQVCNARAEEIDPTINGLNRQIHALNEDMDRVFALRNDESGSYLIQENAQLKRDVTALQTALRSEIGQHQAQLTDSVKPDQELVQRVQSLEQFITQLKTRINEMREQYESAIIDNVDQRHTIAAQADTIKALQGTPGKYYRGYSPFLHEADDLQLSMLLPTLWIPMAPLQMDLFPLARQWLRQNAALL